MSIIARNDKGLLDAGNDIASLWGGSCYDYTVDFDIKVVRFHCVENGEFFNTDCSFDELKEEYGIDVENDYAYLQTQKTEMERE